MELLDLLLKYKGLITTLFSIFIGIKGLNTVSNHLKLKSIDFKFKQLHNLLTTISMVQTSFKRFVHSFTNFKVNGGSIENLQTLIIELKENEDELFNVIFKSYLIETDLMNVVIRYYNLVGDYRRTFERVIKDATITQSDVLDPFDSEVPLSDDDSFTYLYDSDIGSASSFHNIPAKNIFKCYNEIQGLVHNGEKCNLFKDI